MDFHYYGLFDSHYWNHCQNSTLFHSAFKINQQLNYDRTYY